MEGGRGQHEVDLLPSDDYRCTTTTSTDRCPRSRLPGTTLCRRHHLQHVLIPSTTISLTNPLAVSTAAAATAAAQPNKRGRRPTTTTPPEQPNNNAPTLPSNRCTRNDGRGWRCSYPCLPGNHYCDKHDKYYRRKRPRSTVQLPVEENLVVVEEAASAHANIATTVISPSMPLPPVPPGYMQVVPPLVRMKKVEAALELASPTMQVEKPPAVINVNHPKPPPKIFRVGGVYALPAVSGGPLRSYARIDRIIQRSRKAEVTLLAPHPVTDEENVWVKDGRSLACGTFRTTSHTRVINISSLSHQIAYSEVGKSFNILPKAGEVWAIYDDLETGAAATYHLAEIVSGFTEDCGVIAARLVLAEEGGGFKRELRGRYELRRTFLRRDLLWFSHRVLAVRMAEDAAGYNGGSWKVFS